MTHRELIRTAYAPYETIEHPTPEDWQKSYDALIQLVERSPKNGYYPNTLGYICYYGYHTGQRNYVEARKWFEKGASLNMIESMYKLADMLKDGLGGEKDPDRAYALYYMLYRYCKDQFEGGDESCKFADVALRMGKIFHEGIHGETSDEKALQYALEAQYALNKRKPLHHFGDETVERNIQTLIASLEKPDKRARHDKYYELGLGLIPMLFINDRHWLMIQITSDGNDNYRFDFRRIRPDGETPNPVLLAVPPAMKCFMTKSLVVYGTDVTFFRQRNSGRPIICDQYRYNESNHVHLFMTGNKVLCKIRDGRYMLSMVQLYEESQASPNSIMH